jgi:hypothetical protein
MSQSCALLLSGNTAHAFMLSLAMSAHVSLAAGPPVLVGDVPATMAALTERVKLVRRRLCHIPHGTAGEISRVCVTFLGAQA